MGYVRDRVFILRQEPLAEHDAWISMYGQKHGKMTGIARGHRRSSGKQLGHMEPLVLAEVMVAEGKQYDKIAVSRVVDPLHALRSDLAKTVIAGCCVSLTDMLTRPGVNEVKIFNLLAEVIEALGGMKNEPSHDRAQLFYSWFALRLLSILGHVASFGACVICREPLTGDVFALPDMGGAACEPCGKDLDVAPDRIPTLGWKLLRVLQGASCEDVVYLTADKELFRIANQYLSDMLQGIPTDGDVHGYRTISGILNRPSFG
jgi:DNA repair protein RecO (recombination protein O)